MTDLFLFIAASIFLVIAFSLVAYIVIDIIRLFREYRNDS